MAWEHRHEFIHTALPVKGAVAKALAADGRPIVLADMADNTGGGAAGDGTEILRELLRVGARAATVACIWDSAAVQACVKAGVGASVTLDVVGKVDDRHGAPVRVTSTSPPRLTWPAPRASPSSSSRTRSTTPAICSP